MARTGALAAAAACLVALTGCTAAPEPRPSTDWRVETCAQVSDAETLIYNAEAAFRAGRLLESERDGAFRLASRMYRRIAALPGSPLADALADLATALPAAPAPGSAVIDPTAPAARAARARVTAACLDALPDRFGVEGWTGG